MLKKTMTTVDFGGTERTEDYYFNLTKATYHQRRQCRSGGEERTLRLQLYRYRC